MNSKSVLLSRRRIFISPTNFYRFFASLSMENENVRTMLINNRQTFQSDSNIRTHANAESEHMLPLVRQWKTQFS